MDIRLHRKQGIAFTSSATEILYGGAAGGGKSHLLRVTAIALCHSVPGIQVYLFRRLSDDLVKNHVYGAAGLTVLLAQWLDSGEVRYNSTKNEFTWVKTGSRILLCHCQHEKDVIKYQGGEIHVLLIDELTHFSEYIYRFLRNRVRLGGLKVPDQWKGKLPLIICSSNPGSVGHAWVKSTFVNYAPPYDIIRTPPSEGGMMRQYIPARLDDNPTLLENDPNYADRLQGLGSPDLVKAMLNGDWDIVAGAAFEYLSRDVHMVRPFQIPYWWTKFTSLDWGTARPYAIGWYAIADESLVLKGREDAPDKLIGKGSIIRYRELYGWNGKANEGCREESWQVAQKLYDIEGNEEISYRIADNAMWAEHDGPSVAENFQNKLAELYSKEDQRDPNKNKRCYTLEKSRKDRVANYLEIRNRLSMSDGERQGFYVFETCHHFWRTVPDLQLDDREPEKGWDTDQEDHIIDEVGYALVSRPVTMDRKTYTTQKYDEAQEKARQADRGSSVHSRY